MSQVRQPRVETPMHYVCEKIRRRRAPVFPHRQNHSATNIERAQVQSCSQPAKPTLIDKFISKKAARSKLSSSSKTEGVLRIRTARGQRQTKPEKSDTSKEPAPSSISRAWNRSANAQVRAAGSSIPKPLNLRKKRRPKSAVQIQNRQR